MLSLWPQFSFDEQIQSNLSPSRRHELSKSQSQPSIDPACSTRQGSPGGEEARTETNVRRGELRFWR